ncbi:MAG TPA: 4-hydroxy-tetrahydrodipicolinate synthase [Candidatus Saccharimonadales bacterium]
MTELHVGLNAETAGPPQRVMTAMVTPFNVDGSLNRDGAQELAAHLVANGSDGLVLGGTTGESPTLRTSDQIDLFDVVRQAVGENVLLIGGTGSNNTEEAVEMTREADRRGSVDGLLVVSPYYNRPSQFGIDHYYRRIHQETELPVILYNIPVRTGRLVEADTIARLVEDGVVAAVKDATGTTEMAQDLHERFDTDLAIFSGDDSLNLEFARAGAIGAISVASHWAGDAMGQMFDAYFSGDEPRAERLQAVLEPSCQFESTHTDETGQAHDTPNPIPTKVMMTHLLGAEVVGNCLPPMITSAEEMHYLERRAPEILAELSAAMEREGCEVA